MVQEEIVRQAVLFSQAAALGAGLLALYDVLRIIRRLIRHNAAAVAAEDLLFWVFCGIAMFGFMYRENDGVIRGFLVLGAAAGMLLYTMIVSRRILKKKRFQKRIEKKSQSR